MHEIKKTFMLICTFYLLSLPVQTTISTGPSELLHSQTVENYLQCEVRLQFGSSAISSRWATTGGLGELMF